MNLHRLYVFKYVAFCALFLFVIFTSFWVFVWSWRTELVSVLIERSCPPCKAHVQHVEWVDTQTLRISEISLRDQADTELAFVSEAQLTTSPFCWLRWFLIPSKKPLSLSTLVLCIEKDLAYALKPPHPPLFIKADEVIITSTKSDQFIPNPEKDFQGGFVNRFHDPEGRIS